MVFVTAPSEETALDIAKTLVDERLAACVNVVPRITSVYRWEGKREVSAESLLLIKTRGDRYDALQQRVLEVHPYSVAEVLAVPVEAGAPAYLDWVRDSVTGEGR